MRKATFLSKLYINVLLPGWYDNIDLEEYWERAEIEIELLEYDYELENILARRRNISRKFNEHYFITMLQDHI